MRPPYDESESAQAMESLARANAQLRASADGMLEPQALLEAVRDTGGVIVDFIYRDVNRAACTYLSNHREGLLGRSLLATMPNLKAVGLLALFARCVTSREPLILDDVSYDNETLGRRRYDLRGNSARGDFMTLTWRDVTERFDSARRITQSEQRFRLLAENSALPLAVTTPDGRFEVVNEAMCRYFGYDADVLRTKRWPELAPPQYRNADLAEFTDITAGKAATHRGVKEYRHADGHRIWGDLSVSFMRTPNGEVESIIAQIIDITDQVRTADAVREARRQESATRARYRNLMDNAAVGMGVIEPDGHLEEVNQAACTFFGYDAAALKQMTWQQLTAPEYLEADFMNVENMMAGRIDSFRLTKQFIHADGHLIWG